MTITTEVTKASDGDTSPSSDAKQMFWVRASAILRNHKETPTLRGELAAARRARTIKVGGVPALWSVYQKIDRSETYYVAEHYCIGLYGMHQQGTTKPMHVAGQKFGIAMRGLFVKLAAVSGEEGTTPLAGNQSFDDRVSRKMAALAAATTYELTLIKLGIVVGMLAEEQIPLDYTDLFHRIVELADESRRPEVLRSWALDYIRNSKADKRIGEQSSTADEDGEA